MQATEHPNSQACWRLSCNKQMHFIQESEKLRKGASKLNVARLHCYGKDRFGVKNIMNLAEPTWALVAVVV